MYGGFFRRPRNSRKSNRQSPALFYKKRVRARSNEALLAGFYGVCPKMKFNSNLDFKLRKEW